MALKQRLYQLAGKLYFERPAQKLPLRDHARSLRSSGDTILSRLQGVQPTEKHRDVLRHVIGIERWGQRRLRAFLGEPFVLDAHHPYKPTPEASWDELLREFASTREETVRLATGFTDCNTVGVVPHNDFGELSARGWLRYLRGHAEVETRKLR